MLYSCWFLRDSPQKMNRRQTSSSYCPSLKRWVTWKRVPLWQHWHSAPGFLTHGSEQNGWAQIARSKTTFCFEYCLESHAILTQQMTGNPSAYDHGISLMLTLEWDILLVALLSNEKEEAYINTFVIRLVDINLF